MGSTDVTDSKKRTVALSFAFGALTLLAGRQEEHPDCKN